MIEEWRKVVGVPERFARHYQVSSYGAFRSLHGSTHRVLSLRVHRDGYLMASLSDGGDEKKVAAHILVAKAFLGDRTSEGLQVRHWNGVPSDNDVRNLRWGTPQDNADDKRRHGTQVRGETNGRARLTRGEAQSILDSSGTNREVSDRTGVPVSTVGHIRGHRSWKHLSPKGETP